MWLRWREGIEPPLEYPQADHWLPTCRLAPHSACLVLRCLIHRIMSRREALPSICGTTLLTPSRRLLPAHGLLQTGSHARQLSLVPLKFGSTPTPARC
jgi:hypothetical protein